MEIAVYKHIPITHLTVLRDGHNEVLFSFGKKNRWTIAVCPSLSLGLTGYSMCLPDDPIGW